MAAINFPTPPQKQSYQGMTFPSDLITSERQRYCSIDLVKYEAALQFSDTALVKGGGAIKLPMPNSITESNEQEWDQLSLLPSAIESLASGKAGSGLQIGSGIAVNPFLFFKYKNPKFRSFQFEWTLYPTNEKESGTIRKIVQMLKQGSYPSQGGGGALLGYPDLAMVSFTPDEYLFQLKPAAIQDVTINYTPAGQQAWFKNGAPVGVDLKLSIVEVTWWTKDNAGF
jgi:hypothetical protein